MAETIVIAAKYAPKGWKADPQYVDCRRSRSGRIDASPRRSGGLGNPFSENSGFMRSEVLGLFVLYCEYRLRTDPNYRTAVRDLHGKVLVCACADRAGLTIEEPYRCHCQILGKKAAELANDLVGGSES